MIVGIGRSCPEYLPFMSSSLFAMPAIPQYLGVVKDEPKAVSQFVATDPQTKQNLAAFNSQAPGITSPQQLLKNYRVLNVVLGAFGLSSLAGQTAVVKDLMTQSPTSPTSLAVKSGNPAWQSFAKTFSNWTPAPFSSAGTMSAISKNYMTAQFETSEQSQTPGLGNALYFTRTMTSQTTLPQIMSDPKLLNVVETVAGFNPTQFGALDYNQQVRLLKPRVDLKDFSTPDGIRRYAQQYLATLQIAPQPTTTPASTLSLFGADSTTKGILALFA